MKAAAATALHGVWLQFGDLVFLLFLTFGMRFLGGSLAEPFPR